MEQNKNTFDECLWRLGTQKEAGELDSTWEQIADLLNEQFGFDYVESAYRKRFKRMKKTAELAELSTIKDEDCYNETILRNTKEIEKKRMLLNEQRNAQRRALRLEAFRDSILLDLKDVIQALPEAPTRALPASAGEQEMIALLSDIHYGLSFQSQFGEYSPEIAEQRVMAYAERICEIGRKNNINKLHVLLLGDLISGIIHPTIRLENQRNIIEQIVGAANLVSAYLYRLSEDYAEIEVSCVSGNHSRLSEDFANTLRSERLDTLIPWFCQTKLTNVTNIHFAFPAVDATIGAINVFGKTYAFVHGDFDADLCKSAVRIAGVVGNKIDYILAGHLHIADVRLEDTGYIRNGAVVTSGDDYTVKNRLYGPAVQMVLLCSKDGVDALYPVRLDKPVRPTREEETPDEQ